MNVTPVKSFYLNTALYSPTIAQAALAEAPAIKSSYRASVRRMKHLLAAQAPTFVSPTDRFMKAHSLIRINSVLQRYGMTGRDLSLFKTMIAEEKQGFFGYQAGSSTLRVFQDILGMLVKKVLKIDMKDDFFFLRVPGDSTFHYETALDFLKDKQGDLAVPPGDNDPDLRQHILSINMNLYQSYDKPWDLSPRYFLENTTWTHANALKLSKPFFESLGISGEVVDELWIQALDLLPHNRGYILQFFDESEGYAFTKEHAYIAHSGGMPHQRYPNHEILFDEKASDFPQMRLVMSNGATLNPYSSLRMKRYDGLTDQERSQYESSLQNLIEKLSYDPKKVRETREKLLNLWL
ncbi:MAG: hypothetical protein JSS32_03830 [Verrucomicrobia bacterium]|nr:hypothetical protein [Verrucomicrobiota bacterium]